jgi:hypothetical protein
LPRHSGHSVTERLATNGILNSMKPFSLNFAFDAVVMLTWSNWHTEPRSNRYHYATRFARHLPVYFVQPDIPPPRFTRPNAEDPLVRVEALDGVDIKIVHVTEAYGEIQADALDRFLNEQKIYRPLLWIYNVLFEEYIKSSKSRLRIFHATEDYVTPTAGLCVAAPEIVAPIRRVLRSTNLLIAVSEGVASAYRANAGYTGRCLVLPNGCDYGFWQASGAVDFSPPDNGARVALFQGGINKRLDYELLVALAQRLRHWEFWFCGDVQDGTAGWDRLAKQPNVIYHGRLSVDGLAQMAKQSLVGIIPFKQDPWIERSLPLKAYEYVACGLPVVSVPIDALQGKEDIFTIETTADGFARSIERLATTRCDRVALTTRQAAARAQSYDCRFAEAVAAIGELVRQPRPSTSSLNIVILYDDASTFVKTIHEHLTAFDKYSRHRWYFMSGTNPSLFTGDLDNAISLNCFDAVVIHYSVRMSLPQHIAPSVAAAVRRYRGPKLLFIQDEYENTETARRWIERLGVDTVFTTVPLDQVSAIYPSERFPNVDFVATLTGYVPDDPDLDDYALPSADRPIHLGYRGRRLPHHYGVLGFDKYRIGRDMRKLCAEYGIPADIEVDDAQRIYGDDWYRFVGSCRAMLGTESGSNVFDFDGSLKALGEQHADLPFEEFEARFLKNVPTPVDMSQISPKVFEAIRMRTALVLFEGAYSGVVAPGRHYIPLKKDYSNVEQAFKAISDLDYLQELTERAYHDIIEGQRYSYQTFVQNCDRYLDARAGRNPRATLVTIPVAAIQQGVPAVAWPVSSRWPGLVTRSVVESRKSLDACSEAVMAALAEIGETKPAVTLLRSVWRGLPLDLRNRLVRYAEARARAIRAGPMNSIERKAARALTRVLPAAAREILRSWR